MNRYFPELLAPLAAALPERCVVDGEIVIVGAEGLDFEALLLRIHPVASRVKLLAEQSPASFVAWDLLALGDEDLRETPLAGRRPRLEKALARAAPPVHVSPATWDRALAEDWFQRFEGAGLDGVMAKRLDAPYRAGERTMIKVKHARTADCVVAGFRWHKKGPGTMVGSLLLGLYDDDGTLHHVGVTAAFSNVVRKQLVQDLAPLRQNALEGHPSGRRTAATTSWRSRRPTSSSACSPRGARDRKEDEMADFDAALTGFAAFDEDTLARAWTWRDAPMDVRHALYRTLEDAQELYVQVIAAPHPESRRILALAQRAFGDLRGLLTGLTSDLLDTAPREKEWPLRETLRHMLIVERRYAVQTRYALDRADADPVRIPEDRLPPSAEIDVSGDIDAILAQLGAARAETNRLLGDVAPAAMTRPTVWIHYQVDARVRLHRFAAHVTEHTIQCEKTLAVLGWRPTEGRRIVRRVAAAIAEIEGLGALTEARELEARLVERFASVTA